MAEGSLTERLPGFTAVKRESIRMLLTGGNHLASALIHQLGAGWARNPPYTMNWEDAHRIIEDPILYDQWVAWASIMRFRDSLSEGWDA